MKIINYDIKKHTNEKIVIYGNIGPQYITTYCLGIQGKTIYCYANEKGTYVSPYKNISLEALGEMYYEEDIIVILAVDGTAMDQTKKLEDVGIHEVYSARNLWNEVDFTKSEMYSAYQKSYENRNRIFFFEDVINDQEGVYLYSLDAVVTERCSLKCEGCSNLMQYYENPQNMNMDEIITATNKLLDKIEMLLELRILGGEPFVNPEFVKVVDAFINHPKIDTIVMTSNATIFPSDKVLSHLKHPKLLMRMSDYGELSGKLEAWVKWCEDNDIRYEVSEMDRWHDCGRLTRHNYSKYELIDLYGNCDCRNLPTIMGGKLYNCPYAANAANLGAMYKDEAEKDGFIINDAMTSEEIDNFLYERDYLEACRYCLGRSFKNGFITPNIQTKTPLPYEELVNQVKPQEESLAVDKQDKLLSIVVPVYNEEMNVERCLRSIVNQTYRNLEILIVDDGSSDRSVEICERFMSEDKGRRIRLLKNVHAGVVNTRNTGIMQATGEYLAFVDADDYLDMDYLKRMMSHIDGSDWIYNNAYMAVYQNKIIPDTYMDRGQGKYSLKENHFEPDVYERKRLKALWKYMFYNMVDYLGPTLWRTIFKTDMIKKICGLVDNKVFFGEDIALQHIYLLRCRKAKIVNECGYYYCIRDKREHYFSEKTIDNFIRFRKCQKKAFSGHPDEALLVEGVEHDYIHWMLRTIRNSTDDALWQISYYYPYFGRLKDKRVILYGAGNVGKSYYRRLKDNWECMLVAWVDKNAERLRRDELLPVEGIERLKDSEYDYIIIAVYDEPIYEAISEELIQSMGIDPEKILWNPTYVSTEI